MAIDPNLRLRKIFKDIADAIREYTGGGGGLIVRIRPVEIASTWIPKVYENAQLDYWLKSGNATTDKVLSGYTFTSNNASDPKDTTPAVEGTMPNRGTQTGYIRAKDEAGNATTVTILQGFHDGHGYVTATTSNPTVTAGTGQMVVRGTQMSGGGEYDRLLMGKVTVNPTPSYAGSATASTSGQTVFPTSGKHFSSFTVNPQQHSGTYSATSRGASLDMGATHNQRYVNTNNVPNYNSSTYTFPSGSGGSTVDLGETNTYRRVDAMNVYATGYNAGVNSAAFQSTNGWSGSEAEARIQHTCSNDGLYIVVEYASTTKMASPSSKSCTGAGTVGFTYALNGNTTNGAFCFVTEVFGCKSGNVITLGARSNRTHVRIIRCG